MTMTSMSMISILDNGRFVGLNQNVLEYGVIKVDQKAELNCKIDQNTKLKYSMLL